MIQLFSSVAIVMVLLNVIVQGAINYFGLDEDEDDDAPYLCIN